MGRGAYLVLALCSSITLFSSAAMTLVEILPTADVQRMARVVDLEAAYRQSLSERSSPLEAGPGIDPSLVEAISHSPSMQSAVDSGLDDVSRDALEVHLAVLDQAVLAEASDRDLRRVRAAAYHAVAQRLFSAPTDGNAWMLRALLLAQQGGDVRTISKLLDLSYFYAPAEKWIMIPRLRLVASLIESGLITAPPQYGLDLNRVIDFSGPSQVATLYAEAGEKSRRFMRVVIDQQRLERRVQILRLIDAWGVSYPVPAECRTPVSKGTPGSEMELRRPADLVAACAESGGHMPSGDH